MMIDETLLNFTTAAPPPTVLSAVARGTHLVDQFPAHAEIFSDADWPLVQVRLFFLNIQQILSIFQQKSV
ncbi:hypothetical protein GCK72_011511 [Caenorhabditis remanei]|uniref:Uncharacterized protein n=1 Tax=Caenorhabditis remanei TaxID=31234 RepID=A0A6A5H7Z9_CAERE|nr:hypothetical protein GCK72_011511 [Caenorhabditis remanei]KAF1763245.1 hypothetical protein GCK72_011511 [Caenorhabditis remanei]